MTKTRKPGVASVVLFVLGGASVAYAQSDPYAAPGSSGLEQGGLTPPGTGPTPSDTAYEPKNDPAAASMEEAKTEDSGRGLSFLWLNAEGGYEVLGLQSFKANNLVDKQIVKSREAGPIFGVGAGVQLVALTLGGRFRLGTFGQWQLFTLNAEGGLHIPIGSVEPYFTFGGGYASLGAFDPNNTNLDLTGADVRIHGWNVRGGFGLDFFLTPVVSIGANLTGEILFLTRPGVSASKLTSPTETPTDAEQKAAQLYAADGSSIGTGGTLTGVVGLHF
jgi:hypothetical protein